MKIQEWLKKNKIKYSQEENYPEFIDILGFGICLILSEKERVFDEDMNLILSSLEYDISSSFEFNYYLFEFGENWYYVKEIKISNFNILKYIGEYDGDNEGFHYLGVHGGYEILNGSREYKDWIKKAIFMRIPTLSICEKNTLAGVLKFQIECENKGINYLIGEEIVIKDNDDLYRIKVFVKDSDGWKSLLSINNLINIENNSKFIEYSKFIELAKGLIIVLDTKYIAFKKSLQFSLQVDLNDLYYQIDSVIYDGERDEWYLKNLKEFLESSYKPVLINDSYYLDEEECQAKKILNSISGERDFMSRNQYFKSLEDNLLTFGDLFEDENRLLDLINDCLNNLNIIVGICSKFKIQTKIWHLPKYNMTQEESDQFTSNEELFLDLIQKGLENKVSVDLYDKYLERVSEEYPVIADNGFIDYFLILWDIVKYAKDNGILVGIGRGSAGGSLIAYLLNIIELDPIKYNLLFSRFLNEGRAKVTFPDIDTDFAASRKDEIKRYLEQRYGFEQVCSVGTYTNLQLKAAFKDLCRLKNVSFEEMNYISQILDLENGQWIDIFKTATSKSKVYEFVQKYPDIIEDIQLIFKQPRSKSIHACATLILPKEKSIFEWLPIRIEHRDEQRLFVTEWEGSELESAGFLKEDILGIKQLDKYAFILESIKKDLKEDVNIYHISVDDDNVINLFRKGYNGDIFHLGSMGLTKYCIEIQPESIEDLIAAIALYRPGSIENNFHNEYISRKRGTKEIEYLWGTESATKNTLGLIVYQESVMQICVDVGGFNLMEADDVRRCLDKDTYFWTSNGYIKIKDLEKKSNLLTYSNIECKNKLNSVNRVFKSGQKKCVKLIFKSGRELICSNDHRIYTINGWIDAENCINEYALHEIQEKYGTHSESFEKLYLITALITEGSLRKNGCFFINQDLREISTFKKCYFKIFKKDVKEYYNKKSKCIHLYIPVCEVLLLGIELSLSNEKVLPEYFLSLKERQLRFVIGKLIDFDGYIGKEGNINYSSKSKKLIDQLHLMFECLGCRVNISKHFNSKYQAFYYELHCLDGRDLKNIHKKLSFYSYKIKSFDKNKIKQTFNGGGYLIPNKFWFPKIQDLILNSGYKWNELLNSFIVSRKDTDIVLEKLQKILRIVGRNKELEYLLKKEVYWDKVIEVVDVGERDVWDFSMEWNCIPQAYANGILVHNSMGKKKKDVLDAYRNQFVQNAIKNNCSQEDADNLWETLEKFTSYSFNRSHAAAYAITGYIGQWLKFYYPLQFWTAAFHFDDPNPKKSNVSRFISEIRRSDSFIKIMPPNINESGEEFTSNPKKMEIYWSISKVKQVGEKALEFIMKERNERGQFFSLEEFLSRVEKRVVNKAVVINLILSGSFDEIEDIKSVSGRKFLINKYYECSGTKRDKNDEYLLNHEDYWWQIKQKEISGFGYIDYTKVIKDHTNLNLNKYQEADTLQDKESNSDFIVAGMIKEFIIKKTKHDDEYLKIILDSNDEEVHVVVWNDIFLNIPDVNVLTVGSIFIMDGVVIMDNYKKCKVIHSDNKSNIYII